MTSESSPFATAIQCIKRHKGWDCCETRFSIACERQTFLLAHRRKGTFSQEERLGLIDRNSILMTQNLSGIRSEALIGRRSSFIVLAIVYEWQTKDKRPQRSNVNAKNLEQNSQYLWNIVFSWRSIWVYVELIRWSLYQNRQGEM